MLRVCVGPGRLEVDGVVGDLANVVWPGISFYFLELDLAVSRPVCY